MKNKLIIIIENHVQGGANKYTEDLIYCLKDNFQDIEIWGNKKALASFSMVRLPSDIKFKTISIFNAGELTKFLHPFLRKLFRVLLTPFFFIFNIISLLNLKFNITRSQPGLVLLCNGGYPASLYLDLASLFIKPEFSPTMTIVSTPTRKENFFFEPFWKILDEIVTFKCKNIIANSMAIKNELIEKYRFPENKIFILKNGIFDQSLPRRQFSDIVRIGFVSRIEKAKGIEELLLAYEKLKFNHKNIKLIIAGGGSLSSLVTEAAKKDSSINYLGHLSCGLNELLHEIDIYVLPSYQEGLPYSIIEASMAGCAIVATNVGGIPELIKDKYSGILIPPKSDSDLYKALESLIINHDLRMSLANNARQNFVDNLSMEKMQEQTRKIFL